MVAPMVVRGAGGGGAPGGIGGGGEFGDVELTVVATNPAASNNDDGHGHRRHLGDGHGRPAAHSAAIAVASLDERKARAFARETWALLRERWTAHHTPRGCGPSAQKAVLIAAANCLFLSVRFGAGVFLSLTPYLETEFWDANGTVVGGGPEIGFSEGIGLADSVGSALGSAFNMATGCVVTAAAASGTLKGRLLFCSLLVSFVVLSPLVGLMVADDFWAFFGAYISMLAAQGVMTAIVVPVQLLIAPESKFLVQALADIALYVGGLAGMATVSGLQSAGGGSDGGGGGNESSSRPSSDTTLAGVIACATAGGGGGSVNGTTAGVLWACMHLRMRGFVVTAALATCTFLLFAANPLVWKHVRSCCCSGGGGSRGRLRVEPATPADGDGGGDGDGAKSVGGRNANDKAEANGDGAAAAAAAARAGHGAMHADVSTMTDKQQLDVLFDDVFGGAMPGEESRQWETTQQQQRMLVVCPKGEEIHRPAHAAGAAAAAAAAAPPVDGTGVVASLPLAAPVSVSGGCSERLAQLCTTLDVFLPAAQAPAVLGFFAPPVEPRGGNHDDGGGGGEDDCGGVAVPPVRVERAWGCNTAPAHAVALQLRAIDHLLQLRAIGHLLPLRINTTTATTQATPYRADFEEGFREINNGGGVGGNAGVQAAVAIAACKRIWRLPDYVLLTVASTVVMIVLQSLVVFLIVYQVDVFGDDGSGGEAGLPGRTNGNNATSTVEADAMDRGEDGVSVTTITYVTAGSTLAALVFGIGVLFLQVFGRCVNESTRSFFCCGCTRPAPGAPPGRVLSASSLAFIIVTDLTTAAAMLGCYALDGPAQVEVYWFLQWLMISAGFACLATIRALIIDAVAEEDYALAVSQATLFSTLFGAVPGPLVWGVLAGTELGQRGTFLVFSFIPLLVIPFCVALWARLKRTATPDTTTAMNTTATAATTMTTTASLVTAKDTTAAVVAGVAAQAATAPPPAAADVARGQRQQQRLLRTLVRAAALPDDGKARQHVLKPVVRRYTSPDPSTRDTMSAEQLGMLLVDVILPARHHSAAELAAAAVSTATPFGLGETKHGDARAGQQHQQPQQQQQTGTGGGDAQPLDGAGTAALGAQEAEAAAEVWVVGWVHGTVLPAALRLASPTHPHAHTTPTTMSLNELCAGLHRVLELVLQPCAAASTAAAAAAALSPVGTVQRQIPGPPTRRAAGTPSQ